MGEPEVVIVGRNSYIGGWLAEQVPRWPWDVTLVGSRECDFLDPGAVEKFFTRWSERPCRVVFLAVVNKSVENSFRAYGANVAMVRSLIEGCRRADVRSIVYFSSVDVYGRGPRLPITEETAVAPDTWYGLAKYCGEWMLRTSGEVRCPVTVLRIPGVYGHGPRDKSVIGRMVASIRKDGRVVIRGDGGRLRDYVYAGDVARLVEALIPLEYDGVLNVTTGVSRSIRETAVLARRVLGVEGELVHEAPDGEREFDLVFDTQALTRVLPEFRFSDPEAGIGTYA